tara:strand:- start:495 stop:647 length:153 start_codon:yes stop_codon:yes gene_type:complete
MLTNEKWHESQESLMLANAWQSVQKGPGSGGLEVYEGLVQNHKDKSKVHF